MWELDYEESWAPKNWCFWIVVLEKTLESPLDCKEIQPVHSKGDQFWVFTGRTDAKAETPIMATSCEELTHWKRPWCWERSKAGGEGDDRGWDGWMASPIQWTWVWVSSRSWWWTGKPGVLQSMGLQRGGHDWATELKHSVYSMRLWPYKEMKDTTGWLKWTDWRRWRYQSSLAWPPGATRRRQRSISKQAGLHQTSDPPAPWSWTCQHPELWEMFKQPSLWYLLLHLELTKIMGKEVAGYGSKRKAPTLRG